MLASISRGLSFVALRADLKVAPTLPVLAILVLWTSTVYYYQKHVFGKFILFHF
jgi:hypothetical protein